MSPSSHGLRIGMVGVAMLRSPGGPPFEIPDEWLDRLGRSAAKLSCPRRLERGAAGSRCHPAR